MAEFPIELFDPKFYFEGNADVAAGLTLENRFTACLDHYRLQGFRERRNPNILFNANWYVQQYKINDDVDPLVHFAEHEGGGDVSPNPFWQFVKTSSDDPSPRLGEILTGPRHTHKPTYILGLFGTGRLYVNSLVMSCSGSRGYYFLDGLRYQTSGLPIISSGHATISKENVAGHANTQLGRSLLDLAGAGLAKIVFIYRHPLDSLLTNWVWWRAHLSQNGVVGINSRYSTDEQFYEDLDRNFYEFSLFCAGAPDFMRLYGSDLPAFFSLSEFISETACFVDNKLIHKFRFEDFVTEPRRQFSELLGVIDPNAKMSSDIIPRPDSAKSRYSEVLDRVSGFKALISTLPAEHKSRISELGYEI